MSNYSMVGNGTFGGSNNFLAQMAGVAEDAVYGMNNTMNFANNLMSYQNRVATNPSAVGAAIAENINRQGLNTGQHYVNYMRNAGLSYLAGGGDPSNPSSPYFNLFGNSLSDRVRGTPALGNTPAYTQQPLRPVNTSGTPNTIPQQSQSRSVIYNPDLEQQGW